MLSGRILHRSLLRQATANRYIVRKINYDGETYSKSSLNLLTKEDDGHTYVEAFSPIGFRLSNGLRILGPCALFPKTVLHWNVASSKRITTDSLTLFSVLEPKPDILIIGIGERGSPYDKNIIKFLRSKRINVEVLPTEQACSTFNFLNSERRVVAAALIPPAAVESSYDDFVIEDTTEGIEAHNTPERRKLEEPDIMAAVTRNMETINKKGLAGLMSEKDREREHRDDKEGKGGNEGNNKGSTS